MGASNSCKCCSNDNTIEKHNTLRRINTDDRYNLNATDDDAKDDNGTTGNTFDDFKDAIQNGNDSLVMRFVNEHPSLNLLDVHFDNGDNCLHVAVRKRYFSLIYYLLANGVSPNAPNRLTDETALHTAVRTKDCKIITLLEQFDADPNVRNKKQETPIQIARVNKDPDVLEILAPDTLDMIRSITSVRGLIQDRDQFKLNLPDADNLGHAYSIVDKRPFHEKLDKNHQQKLDQLDVQKILINPLSNVKNRSVATVSMLHQINDLTQEKIKLPVLAGWIEKKKKKFPYSWQKRWVVVEETYLLWSDTERIIARVRSRKERNKWNNYLNLMSIKSVEPILTSKLKNKFIINIKKIDDVVKEEYVWRCQSEKDRDVWIKGLRQHIHHIQSILKYLGAH